MYTTARMQLPEVASTYRHYKNHKEYLILCVARHSETGELLVIYQAQYNDPELGQKPIFARPVEMFMEDVEYEGRMVTRFEKIFNL